MKCNVCGSEINGGKFCPECGNPVNNMSQNTGGPIQYQQSQYSGSFNSANKMNPINNTKKKGGCLKTVLIVIGVTFGAIVL